MQLCTKGNLTWVNLFDKTNKVLYFKQHQYLRSVCM